MISNRPRILVILVLVSALEGCGAAGVPLAHPAATGTLTAVEATYINRARERPYVSLTPWGEDAWNDTASIVRLDAHAACFDVTTRYVDAGTPPGTVEQILTLQPETVTLQADTQTFRSPAIEPRPFSERDSQWEVTDSSHIDHTGGIRVDRSHQETMRALSGGGIVCFEHAGAIPPTVRHLRLRYAQGAFEPTFDFELVTEAAVTAWPSARIVASGYEHIAR